MLRAPVTLLCLCFVMLESSCCPSQSSTTPGTKPSDTTGAVVRPAGESVIAVQPNATAITATIDSMANAENGAYRLSIGIVSARQVGSMPNLTQPGQHITVTPRFDLNAAGDPDTLSVKTKRLLNVRREKPGDLLEGTVSLDAHGNWILLDVRQP